jgi:hypothetical protein
MCKHIFGHRFYGGNRMTAVAEAPTLTRGDKVKIADTHPDENFRGKTRVVASPAPITCRGNGRCAGNNCQGEAVFLIEKAPPADVDQRKGWRQDTIKLCTTHLTDTNGILLVPADATPVAPKKKAKTTVAKKSSDAPKRRPGRPKKNPEAAVATPKRKPGRPRKNPEAAEAPKRKPGRQKKNPDAAPVVKRKLGRPKKNPDAVAAPKRKPGRPKKAETVAAAPKKRGRPRKVKVTSVNGNGQLKLTGLPSDIVTWDSLATIVREGDLRKLAEAARQLKGENDLLSRQLIIAQAKLLS